MLVEPVIVLTSFKCSQKINDDAVNSQQVNDGVFKGICLRTNNISFKKDTEKLVLLQVKGLMSNSGL